LTGGFLSSCVGLQANISPLLVIIGPLRNPHEYCELEYDIYIIYILFAMVKD